MPTLGRAERRAVSSPVTITSADGTLAGSSVALIVDGDAHPMQWEAEDDDRARTAVAVGYLVGPDATAQSGDIPITARILSRVRVTLADGQVIDGTATTFDVRSH